MKTQGPSGPHHPTPFLLAAALAAGALSGCKEHAEGDGHDHGVKPAARSETSSDERAADSREGEHADEVTLTAEAIGRYGVKVEVARRRALTPTIVAPARVSFNTDAMAHVGSPLRGRAVEIKVKLGDTVKRGDALLAVESPELGEAQADYFQKRTAVLLTGPAVDLARAAWERAKALFEQTQGISLTEVQKREAEYKAAVAAQRAAESVVIGVENRLHLLGMSQGAIETLAATGEIAPRMLVQAPINGQVVQREVTLGELVGPEREALMVLADTSTLWVLADVPGARLDAIAGDAKAWVTIGSLGVPGARTFEGHVAFVAPLVDAATRTAQVRIEVPSESLSLKPGMFAEVEIAAGGGAFADAVPAIAVPEEAVRVVEGGPVLFVPVMGEPGAFAKRGVRVGKPVGGLVPILSGLDEGEEFVAAGTFILKAELGKGSAAHEH
ncbi:MAG: efflux RND transporter periplasmic adaptor subunit [Phycisphaerales bacterium]|jgi:cobalt-zinc-cadmium efflux system membrane fusion protein|nr:efflux RND transporter periplasmic adaptor subunit [Phycisphaerales bacterium]